MSRKCPKRYHLFLNWLKVNRSRFPFEPRVTRQSKNRINFELLGITTALRFEYYCRLSPRSCSWLSVNAMWQGEAWEMAAFIGAEIPTDKGWITLMEPPENRRYWRTREELWIELCFEAFLVWCNKLMTSCGYVEFCHKGEFRDVSLVWKSDEDPLWVPLSVKYSKILDTYPEKCESFVIPFLKQNKSTAAAD